MKAEYEEKWLRETFKPPHYAGQFKCRKPIWHTRLLYDIVAYEMLTNHSEQTYGKINDSIIRLLI